MALFVSPTAGTRNTPKDSYIFTRGTTASIKATFTSDGSPTKVDNATSPVLRIRQPGFIDNVVAGVPVGIDNVITTIQGTLTAGQEYEYEFIWNIPAGLIPSSEYVLTYEAQIGGSYYEYGSELLTIRSTAGLVNMQFSGFCTVDDVRNHKFNIDDYLPKLLAKDLISRNRLIESHIRIGSEKLTEELNIFQSRGFSVNYKLFTIYYTIYSILLSSRGEDGSSVSDQNISFYKQEWTNILNQEKREGSMQSIGLGRG